MEAVRVLGVPFHRVDMAAAVATVAAFLDSDRPNLVVTANPETVMVAREDTHMAQVLEKAQLVVADGVGVVWAARRQGTPLPERVPGVELAEKLVAHCAQEGYRVYLLGGAPGVALAAAKRLGEKHPGLQVVGTAHGYFGAQEEEQVVAQIKQARPHLLLAGLGMPKQEKWLFQNLEGLAVPVAIGVGGSLDVFAEKVQRAPAVFRRLGLEWFYRLAKEPHRIGRMLSLPRFAWLILRGTGG